MPSLSEALNSFRLASRELFNGYFRVATEPYDNGGWSLLENYCSVEEVLFEQMIGPTCESELRAYGQPQAAIRVSLLAGDFAPIMVNREVNSGYWDNPICEVKREAVMSFVRFFDWDQLAIHDNRYVEVVIEAWLQHPELQGKHALIESRYTDYSEA